MPVDKMISDSMLGTFRNMLQECIDKNLSGPAMDNMAAEMAKMEKCALEMDDIGGFSAKLMTDGCFTNFSAYYSQVLSEAAQASAKSSSGSADGGDEDAGYLKQTLQAYSDAIGRYDQEVKSGTMKPKDAEILRQGVQAVIDLGESGVTYPVFLRQMIERGLDKAMEGSALARGGLVTDLEWAKFANMPLEIALRQEILDLYDTMAAAATFQVPDSFLFNLARGAIEWKFAPALAKWKAIQYRWEQIIDLLNDWLDAHCAFAPNDERWIDPGNPAATPKNIRRTKELNAFRLREREKFLMEAFGIDWNGIFAHETYTAAWTNVAVSISAAKIDLLRQAHDQCRPGASPSAELIKAAEQLQASKADFRHAERQAVGQKMKAKFDEHYGPGAYDRQFKAG